MSKENTTTKHSKKNWKQFGNKLETNKHQCFYCGERISDHSRTTDHIIPKSQGGILSNDNKVYACRRCNQFKADTDPETFLGMVKFMVKEMNAQHEEKMSYYHLLMKRLEIIVNDANEQGKENS